MQITLENIVKTKSIAKIFGIMLTLLMNSAILSWAKTPPQDLLDRNIRSVYYETASFGSQSLNITLGELVKSGLEAGVWENEKINIWKYYIYLSDVSGKIHCMSIFFTVVEEVELKKIFEKDIILTNIIIDGQSLKNKDVFDFILPVAVKIYSEKQSNDMTASVNSFDKTNYYLNH
jgi:hypothetical protein